MSESTVEAKQALRALIREQRAALTPEERADAERGFDKQIGSLFHDGDIKRIAAFIPTATEPPITHVLDEVSRAGIEVVLPLSRPDRTMDWAPHPPGADFTVDALGMPAPVGPLIDPAALHTLDLVLCPAATVDSQGYRLGWGLGYYDRFLASLVQKPPVLAVVFDDEFVDEIPREAHDYPVSGVVTPMRVVWF